LNNLIKVINEVLCLSEKRLEFNKEGIDVNIVITSNLGLCGQYNEEVLKIVSKENKHTASYIVFGEKGKNYLNNNGYDILLSYSDYESFEDNGIQDEFSEKIFNLINEGKIKTINVIYTKYINNLKCDAIKEQVYPFEIEKIKTSTNYLIEPNSDEMVKSLLSLLVKTKINSVLLNSVLSENASRNNAMKNAKDNAEELKEELVIVYNKIRQQQITNELSDIVNGM
jgi:F-type H+-transporting ATPase subunit gamma